MPMPPPKPSTEGRRDRQVVHEITQIVRALQVNGPQSIEELNQLIGAPYWDAHRFDRALALARADGLVVEGADGRVHAV
jgi:uncharacterized membrane protein